MSRYAYSAEYDPPAPVLEIVVAAVGRANTTALVDSGADVTLLPITLLDQIDAHYMHTQRLRGVVGGSQTVEIYRVNIEVAAQTIRGIRAVAAAAGHEAILGRDVLNQLVMTLHGPAEVLTLETPPTA